MKKHIWWLLAGALLMSGCRETAEILLPAGEPVQEASEVAGQEERENSKAAIAEETDNTDSADCEEEEIKESVPEVTVVMVGDILLHTPVEEAARQEDGSYNFEVIFENLESEIEAADVAIVNQEVILGGEELGISGYPAFNAPYSAGDALVEAGFDVICHGTNHALDKGRRGLLNCLEFWQNTYPDVAVLGIHDSQEAQEELYIYEQEGLRIAVLNYTYGTNGIPTPEGMPYAVDLLVEEQVIQDLQQAEELADFTIVCPHWGTEYQLEQSAEQKKWAQLFLKHGADLVLGTHPHVIQPVEWVMDEETSNQMLVYYSLGNFVNWTSSSGDGIANRMVGGLARVTIALENGAAVIADYGIEPVVCHLEDGVNGVTVYKLSDYTPELAQRNRIVKQDPDFSLEYCKNLCEQVWSGDK